MNVPAPAATDKEHPVIKGVPAAAATRKRIEALMDGGTVSSNARSEFELRQLEELRNGLDQEFRQRTTQSASFVSRQRIYSKDRT